MFLDATHCKARVGRRVVSQAVVVAVGVASDGRREVLGSEVGDTEPQPFWTTFLPSLKARGLDGVKLVISDAHTGLIAAIETVFVGSSWQRCRVHFMRNVLANVHKTAGPAVASIIRTIFAQPDKEACSHPVRRSRANAHEVSPEGRRDARRRPRRPPRIRSIPRHEWDAADRRYFSEHSMTLLNTTEESEEEVAIPALTAA